jgi:23S rRNA (cytidine1920-2'-O)/16S rRNA (cytidine1409-2'-O)-methyltransferase
MEWLIPMTGERERLDIFLVKKQLVRSRSEASDAIRRGLISVNGAIVTRPAFPCPLDASISITGDAGIYVSRGALKLIAALDAFAFDAAGRVALDVGASTGGFTQVLLMRGATRVYAVDVGSSQLHLSLKNDPRVFNLEELDARRLHPYVINEPINAITADVSFISLTKVLPAAMALAAPGAWLAALVKPQFEAGREAVGKGGIVKSEAAREEALATLTAFVAAQPGWSITGTIPSPILGQSGNAEYLLGARYAS